MTVPGQGAEAPSTREDPGGTDRVKSAEVPTNVKEVVARFAFVEQRFGIVDQTEFCNPPYDGAMLVPQRDVLQDW